MNWRTSCQICWLRGLFSLMFPHGVLLFSWWGRKIYTWGFVWIIESWTKLQWITSIIFLVSMIYLISYKVNLYSVKLSRSGYHKLEICALDKMKTTFRTSCGHYKFFVMSFCLTKTLAAFMELMNRIFWPYIDSFVRVFIKGILVYSMFEGVQDRHLREEKLYAKFSNYEFWHYYVAFFGHVVSKESLRYIHPILMEWGVGLGLYKYRGSKFLWNLWPITDDLCKAFLLLQAFEFKNIKNSAC